MAIIPLLVFKPVSAPALRHRLIFSYEGEASGMHPDELVAEAWKAAGGS